MLVNHKRVVRLMREDNLLAVQPKSFVTTTDSDHELEVYLNLARRMKLTGINQLWVADITYIRLRGEFVYLAVVLDAFSRKVVGWALERNLTARLPLLALSRAIAQRPPPGGPGASFLGQTHRPEPVPCSKATAGLRLRDPHPRNAGALGCG
jgi:transposase InsO family protein